MDCIAIIDTSCIIWDSVDYDNNTHEYMALKDKLVNLFDVFERENPHILLRDELITEIMAAFPYERVHLHPHDYNHRVVNFIINIPRNRKLSCLPNNTNVISTPTVHKNHFSNNTRLEISYILTQIHSNHTEPNCYFAYPYLFGHPGPLSTNVPGNQVTRQCNTLFFDDEAAIENYFSQFRKIFEPNPVHHHQNRPRSRKSRLRCYNGNDTLVPQDYLNRSIFENNRYYFYDPTNQVYVVFLRHNQNRYHGHEEENLNAVPPRIRQHFNI